MEYSFFHAIFWFFLIFVMAYPAMKKRMLEAARLKMLRMIEKKRSSRVIALIHRQEVMTFLGFPLMRFLNIEDSEQVLRAIRMTPDDMDIDLILHTPGGLVLATEQIASALSEHPARVTVHIPHYAMSGGAFIAFAADEIIMDKNAVLGPIDPQLGEYPAASILRVAEQKNREEMEDRTLILADVAQKAVNQVRASLIQLLSKKMPEKDAEKVAEVMSSGQFTHDYPITVSIAGDLKLPVKTELAPEIYELMNLFPQPGIGRPSVLYVPTPYGKPEGPKDRSANISR